MAQTRWSTIQSYWTKEYTWLWLIPGVILGSVIGFLVGIASTADVDTWFISGFWPELLGTAMTVVIVDRLVDYRAKLRAKEDYKQELFRQAKSRSNDFAVDALRQIQDNDWWMDMLNHYRDESNRINLSQVQWAGGAKLQKVDLQNAKLNRANLQNAKLNRANLQNTELHFAKLQSASLGGVNLRGSKLTFADLQSAFMWQANLEGATLAGANLRNVSLARVKFDEETILPDTTNWTPKTDMERYTNPNHPDFWKFPLGE